MIKEKIVLIKINLRNISHYTKKGYEVKNFDIKKEYLLEVKVEDIPVCSKTPITAICNNCKSENVIPISKYYVNFNRNNKGYYSCFNCKGIIKDQTCLEKYGVKSYSQTTEFKNIDKSNWNYEQGVEKGRKTKLERYGVDSWFKLDIMRQQNKKWMSSNEFREKSKITLIEKYGVDSFSKTDEFKKIITNNKTLIVEKIKKTFLEKYGVDWMSKTDEYKINYKNNLDKIREKIKNTCMEKYGVENVSQVKEIYEKILSTKKSNGIIPMDDLLSDWEIYKKKSRTLTNKIKKKLYERWDGFDYYDSEFIKGNFSYIHTHRFYPTIDHKISVFYGFSNNIPVEEICDISNLCVTKRWINSSKNSLIEENFSLPK